MVRNLFSGGLKKIFLFLVILCIFAISVIGIYSINKASAFLFERTEAISLLKMQDASKKLDSIVNSINETVLSVEQNIGNILSIQNDGDLNNVFSKIINDETIEACYLRIDGGKDFLYNPHNIPIDVIQIQIFAGSGNSNNKSLNITPLTNIMPYGMYHLVNSRISVDLNGEKAGLYLFVNSKIFDEIINEMKDNNNLIVILNESGSTISVSDLEMLQEISNTNLMFKMHETNTDVFEFQKYAETQIIARYISQETGIKVFWIYDRGDFYNEVYKLWYAVIVFVAIFISLIIFIYQLLKKQYIVPFNVLADKMGHMESEFLNEELTIQGGEEINLIIKQFNKMQKSIKEMLVEVSNKEEQKRQMEMKALRYQINPHFLYNTVSNMRILAISKGETEIGNYLSKLSQMYKYIFSTKENFVTIQAEMEFIKNYISLMNVRYENRISTFFLLDEALNECLIPVFLLQPLVENAILHGLSKKLNKGEECLMRIEIKLFGDSLRICVFDNGCGIKQDQIEVLTTFNGGKSKRDSGLFNTVSRLKNLYSDKYNFNIRSVQGEFTEITVDIPFEIIDTQGVV